jgi:hypothetical protein
MKTMPYWAFALALGFSLTAAFAGPPKSFQRQEMAQWVTYEIRDDVDFQRAWNLVIDNLITEFDLDFVTKEDGYLRTAWLYSFGGKYNFEYRLRVTVRFAPDHKNLRIKAEAQFKDGNNWIQGIDSRLISTLKTDLMGTIGRTAR